MIKSTQKVIKIGSSNGVTIPAKDLAKSGIKIGDNVEVTIKSVKKDISAADAEVLAAAKRILKDHRKDFENLVRR